MANVVIQASLNIIDELGTTATLPVFLEGPDTATLANVSTAINAIASAADPIIGGQIVDSTVTFHPGLPGGIKVTPAAGSRVEQTGLFNWSNSVTPYKFGIDVPSIANGVISGGKIDITDADVEAFIDIFEAAIGVFTAVTGGYDPLLSLIDVALTFRKHRKQLTRSSREVGAT